MLVALQYRPTCLVNSQVKIPEISINEVESKKVLYSFWKLYYTYQWNFNEHAQEIPIFHRVLFFLTNTLLLVEFLLHLKISQERHLHHKFKQFQRKNNLSRNSMSPSYPQTSFKLKKSTKTNKRKEPHTSFDTNVHNNNFFTSTPSDRHTSNTPKNQSPYVSTSYYTFKPSIKTHTKLIKQGTLWREIDKRRIRDKKYTNITLSYINQCFVKYTSV